MSPVGWQVRNTVRSHMACTWVPVAVRHVCELLYISLLSIYVYFALHAFCVEWSSNLSSINQDTASSKWVSEWVSDHSDDVDRRLVLSWRCYCVACSRLCQSLDLHCPPPDCHPPTPTSSTNTQTSAWQLPSPAQRNQSGTDSASNMFVIVRWFSVQLLNRRRINVLH